MANEPESITRRQCGDCVGACGSPDHEACAHLLVPRAQVTPQELRRMPASMTTAEAMPWTRLSRSAFYKMLATGEIGSCRLGHSIRIPTRRFLLGIGVLEEDEA